VKTFFFSLPPPLVSFSPSTHLLHFLRGQAESSVTCVLCCPFHGKPPPPPPLLSHPLSSQLHFLGGSLLTHGGPFPYPELPSPPPFPSPLPSLLVEYLSCFFLFGPFPLSPSSDARPLNLWEYLFSFLVYRLLPPSFEPFFPVALLFPSLFGSGVSIF